MSVGFEPKDLVRILAQSLLTVGAHPSIYIFYRFIKCGKNVLSFCHTMLISLKMLQTPFHLHEMQIYLVVGVAMLTAPIFSFTKKPDLPCSVLWLRGGLKENLWHHRSESGRCLCEVMDLCSLDLIGCLTSGTDAPKNSVAQGAVVLVAEHSGLPAAPHPSALTNLAPHEAPASC